MTDSGFINPAFRPQPGRKYYNHTATHSRGEWHRQWLLTSGQYIKTSEPDMRKGYGWKIVGEAGPELINFRQRQPIAESINDITTAMNLSQRFATLITADDIRALRAQQMDQSPRSPDCRDGNCRKCDGQAWDDTTDALASCGCTCHLEPTH